MNKYNFFISYCAKDGREIAEKVRGKLVEKGYSVFMDVDAIESGYFDYSEVVAQTIASCDCFLPIITDGYNFSQWAKREMNFALSLSAERSKTIIPLWCAEKMSKEIEMMLGPLQILDIKDESRIKDAVDIIDTRFGHQLKSEILYEKLAGYKRLNNPDKEAEVICELIKLLLSQQSEVATKAWCREMLTLYDNLSRYSGDYEKESVAVARNILTQLDATEKIWKDAEVQSSVFYNDWFYISFVLRMIFMDKDIRKECADITTQGRAHNACPDVWYIEKQKLFTEAYYREKERQDGGSSSQFTREELAFIKETEEFILENVSLVAKRPYNQKKERPAQVMRSKDDEILSSIAKFIQEGNKLFDVLQKNGIKGSFLKCLLTSYERLRDYCEVVGEGNIAADCVDRIVEIRSELDKGGAESTKNEKAENGIKSLLGYTLKDSGRYDVFISFKSEDSDLAEKIYRYCLKYMKEPFWSKKSLPELSKSDYEDAIYAALRNSKHFVVVASNIEYLQSNWVKTEMSTFHRAITEGRKEDANFVFVVTDDVYRKIIESNKMCLDERYCGYQIIKMSEYEETLSQYFS